MSEMDQDFEATETDDVEGQEPAGEDDGGQGEGAPADPVVASDDGERPAAEPKPTRKERRDAWKRWNEEKRARQEAEARYAEERQQWAREQRALMEKMERLTGAVESTIPKPADPRDEKIKTLRSQIAETAARMGSDESGKAFEKWQDLQEQLADAVADKRAQLIVDERMQKYQAENRPAPKPAAEYQALLRDYPFLDADSDPENAVFRELVDARAKLIARKEKRDTSSRRVLMATLRQAAAQVAAEEGIETPATSQKAKANPGRVSGNGSRTAQGTGSDSFSLDGLATEDIDAAAAVMFSEVDDVKKRREMWIARAGRHLTNGR